MDTTKGGVDGLSLLANLNWDRFLFLGLIGFALFGASYMVSM